jgi:hypothetical protein
MAKNAASDDWTAITLRRPPVLLAERSTFARWTGGQPLGGASVLHYWGFPLASKLPKHLQPNGPVGHQYLECATDEIAAARYAEIHAALREVYPKLALQGPEPGAPKLLAQLRKKHAYFTVPDENGMTLALEPASALLRAEHASSGSGDESPFACTFTTPAGGEAAIVALDGKSHLAVRDRELVFVSCPKSGQAKTLAAALAGTAVEERTHATITVHGRELVLASARTSGSELDADVAKGSAAILPCRPGTYAIRGGYEYPVSVVRLVAE